MECYDYEMNTSYRSRLAATREGGGRAGALADARQPIAIASLPLHAAIDPIDTWAT